MTASTPSAREGELAEVLARVLHDEIGGCCLERIDACVFGGADVKHEAERVAEFLTAAGFGPVAEVEAERDRIARINEENWAKLGGYVEAWGPLLARAESAEAAHAGLRAGVEALADDWEATVFKLPPGYPMTVNEFCRLWFKAPLRALLRHPRPEGDRPMSDPSGATNGDWDPDDEWVWCTDDCPQDCMADHKGEE